MLNGVVPKNMYSTLDEEKARHDNKNSVESIHFFIL